MKQTSQKRDLLYDLEEKIPQIKQFKKEMYDKTVQYQKKLGFKIGEGQHATWNNEADAFKHTFMEALLTIKYIDIISNLGGKLHERNGNKYMAQPSCEDNMDLWNNQVGREIGKEIKKEIKENHLKYTQKQIEDIIAVRVMKKMRKGELITNPFTDKRSYEKKIHGSATGYAANIPEKKIFTAEEIGKMSTDEILKNEKAINNQLKGIGVPREYQAKEAVKNGTMIWVNSYTRDDGTEVKGYYRSRPSD